MGGRKRDSDTVDWSRLWFDYQPASEEVPALIAALRGADADARRRAARRIIDVHFEEGAFSASAPLASHLLRMLRDPDQEDKQELVRALAHIGLIEPARYELGGGKARDRARLSGGEADNPGRPTAKDYAGAWKAVKQGSDVYIEALEHPSPALRCGAAWLLGFMTHAQKKVTPALLERALRDADRLVRTHALLALGLLHAPKGSAKVATAIGPCIEDTDPAVRGAAGVAFASLAGRADDRGALEEAASQGSVPGLWFENGDLGKLARAVRRERGLSTVDEELERIEQEAAKGARPSQDLWGVFWKIFPQGFRPVPKRRPASLLPLERRVLELLLKIGDPCTYLATIGLVSGSNPLGHFLAAGDPLSVEILVGERRDPFWCAFSDAAAGLSPPEPFIAASLALGPGALLAAWKELVGSDPYGLWEQIPAPSSKDHQDSRPVLPWKQAYHVRFTEMAATLCVRLGGAGEQAAAELAEAQLHQPTSERVSLSTTLGLALHARSRREFLDERFDALIARGMMVHPTRQVTDISARILSELPALRAARLLLAPWLPWEEAGPMAGVLQKAGGGFYFPSDPTPFLRLCAPLETARELLTVLSQARSVGAAKQPLPTKALAQWLAKGGEPMRPLLQEAAERNAGLGSEIARAALAAHSRKRR